MDRTWLLFLVLGLILWNIYRLYHYRTFRQWLKRWQQPGKDALFPKEIVHLFGFRQFLLNQFRAW